MDATTQDMTAEQSRVVAAVHDWIDALCAGGMTENEAISAVFVSLIERTLQKGSVPEVADWLRRMAGSVDRLGARIQSELREHGR